MAIYYSGSTDKDNSFFFGLENFKTEDLTSKL